MTNIDIEQDMQAIRRQFLIEQFYYKEAELLDEFQFDQWLELFTEDTRYWVPSRVNRMRHDTASSYSNHEEFSLFDDDKTTLGWRVRQQGLATHWAENPRSRMRHLITNVRVETTEDGAGFSAKSNFMCYRNRMQDEVDIWVGERQDILVKIDGTLRIASRTVHLDQSMILSKNLNVFF